MNRKQDSLHSLVSDDELIRDAVTSFAYAAELLPGVVIIHNLATMGVEYMSQKGLAILGITLPEIKALGADYHKRYFNTAEAKEYLPKLSRLFESKDPNDYISLFQQVRPSEKHNWQWYCTSVSVFLRTPAGKPLLTLAIAIPIDPKHHVTGKMNRMLAEQDKMRNRTPHFERLSRRELEILKLIAHGLSSPDIAAQLHISIATVDTHRRNIRQKLEVGSVLELVQYARAFDLI